MCRAVHRDGIRCLERLLKADQTYFKDHKGRTVLHHAAEVGSIAACELVLGLRADAVHDLDRMVRFIVSCVGERDEYGLEFVATGQNYAFGTYTGED